MRDPLQILTGWERDYRADIDRRTAELDSPHDADFDFATAGTLVCDVMLHGVLVAFLDQLRYVDEGLPRTEGIGRRLRAIWNALSGKGVV